MKQYDVIIIGAGPGGYVAAIKAGQEGLKTLVIDKSWWGGVCLNVGCIPTKALLKSAKVLNYFKHAKDYGIDVKDSSFSVNWTEMQKRKNIIVKKLTSGVEFLLKKNKVDTVIGTAIFINKNTIKVNNEEYQAKNIIIATGSTTTMIPLNNFQKAIEENFLITSDEILSLNSIPKSLTIIGGGVIGIEFASLFATLKTKVTVIEALDSILAVADNSVSQEMTKILTKQEINIITKAKAKGFNVSKKELVYEVDGKEQTIISDYVLMSVGRKPVVSNDIKQLNIELGSRGNIITNEYCQTNISNIYAIGDVSSDKMLAHVASSQAIVAIEHILGKNNVLDMDQVPNCIYSFPEIASVGLTEKQVKEKGYDFKSTIFSLKSLGKAIADGEDDGFVKIIVDKKTGEIYGAHIIASTATDMISEITTTMKSEGTINEIANAIHPHPTLSEAIMEAAHGIISKAIHG